MRSTLSIITAILIIGFGNALSAKAPVFPLLPGIKYELNITFYQGSISSENAIPNERDLKDFETFILTYRVEVNQLDASQFELMATWQNLIPTQINTRLFRQNHQYTFAREIGMHETVRIIIDSSGKLISGDPLLLDTMTRQYLSGFHTRMPNQLLPFSLDLFNPSNATNWSSPAEAGKEWQRSLQLITENNLFPSQKLYIRFDYQFKPLPQQALTLNIQETEENYQIQLFKTDPTLDGQNLEISHSLQATYAIEDPSLINIKIYNQNKTLLLKRLFVRPGDHWDITWEGIQPSVHTPYDPWNSVQLGQFWTKYRGNQFMSISGYYRVKLNALGPGNFLNWVAKQYRLEMNWLEENPAPDPLAQKLVWNDSYYTHALYSQFPFNDIIRYQDFGSHYSDSTMLYQPHSEEVVVYAQYLEALVNHKIQNRGLNFNPLNNLPSYQPLTGFYYAIENFKDYARNHLMFKYARIILSNTLFDINTCQHVLRIFQDLVPDSVQNSALNALYEKRESLEKGQYFTNLLVKTPEGNRSLQSIIPGPLLIYSQYRDYPINPDLIINLDKEALADLRIVILSKMNSPKLAAIISNQTGIPVEHIFVFQPAGGETILDTLFIAENDVESSVFSMLLDNHQKIYYAGPNRFAPLYRGLQELKQDLELQNSKLRQNLIRYSLMGFVLLLLITLIVRARERYILQANARKYQQLNLKWQALTGQLNPHFLFNSLASIREMISQNHTQQAANYIQTFSNFLRNILKANRLKRISLQQEIEFSRNYLELEQMRSPFLVKWNIDPDLDLPSIEIPPLLIQPYLENAIKHGISGQQDGIITLNFTRKNQWVHIIITDNGRGLPANMNPGGVGMALGKERMETYYSHHARMHYATAFPERKENPGTMIELWLPIE